MNNDNPYSIPVAIVIAGAMISGTWLYISQNPPAVKTAAEKKQNQKTAQERSFTPVASLEETVIPSKGVTLPVTWGTLGAKLVNAGVIDVNQFRQIYEERGAFTSEYRNLLTGDNRGKLTMTSANAGYLLNLFWALGLANKNPILETGEMADQAYGGAGNFASTGGFSISEGPAMNHYSRHQFFGLTKEQQALVEKVSKGIYRPCCGNSTHFPDCNHGMAMLGLLELMASQGVSETEMWRAALAVNAYWFPDNYLTIAAYLKNKGVDWKEVNPQTVLGAAYSSLRGYAEIASQVVVPPQRQSGSSSCGVDTGGTPAPKQQQSGCGI